MKCISVSTLTKYPTVDSSKSTQSRERMSRSAGGGAAAAPPVAPPAGRPSHQRSATAATCRTKATTSPSRTSVTQKVVRKYGCIANVASVAAKARRLARTDRSWLTREAWAVWRREARGAGPPPRGGAASRWRTSVRQAAKWRVRDVK